MLTDALARIEYRGRDHREFVRHRKLLYSLHLASKQARNRTRGSRSASLDILSGFDHLLFVLALILLIFTDRWMLVTSGPSNRGSYNARGRGAWLSQPAAGPRRDDHRSQHCIRSERTCESQTGRAAIVREYLGWSPSPLVFCMGSASPGP